MANSDLEESFGAVVFWPKLVKMAPIQNKMENNSNRSFIRYFNKVRIPKVG
jgi:hypothetical protein